MSYSPHRHDARRARCCRPILSLAVAAYARAASEGVIFACILRRICFCSLQIASAIVVFAYLTTGIIFLSIDVVANACARDRHIRPRAQALATVARSLFSIAVALNTRVTSSARIIFVLPLCFLYNQALQFLPALFRHHGECA